MGLAMGERARLDSRNSRSLAADRSRSTRKSPDLRRCLPAAYAWRANYPAAATLPRLRSRGPLPSRAESGHPAVRFPGATPRCRLGCWPLQSIAAHVSECWRTRRRAPAPLPSQLARRFPVLEHSSVTTGAKGPAAMTGPKAETDGQVNICKRSDEEPDGDEPRTAVGAGNDRGWRGR